MEDLNLFKHLFMMVNREQMNNIYNEYFSNIVINPKDTTYDGNDGFYKGNSPNINIPIKSIKKLIEEKATINYHTK